MTIETERERLENRIRRLRLSLAAINKKIDEIDFDTELDMTTKHTRLAIAYNMRDAGIKLLREQQEALAALDPREE